MALTHVGKMCYNKRQKERRNPQKMNIRGRVWSENFQEQGAKTLNELSGIIDTSRQKEDAFKMVVTATGDCAYQRQDGIIVCPVGALRP